MKKIVLIACARQKLQHRAPAHALYQSPLFRWSLQYAQQKLQPDAIYILSAQHSLVPLDQELEPYDRTLTTMRAAEVRQWAAEVLATLRKVANLETDQFTLLAGKRYRQYLLPHMAHAAVPMAGLTIGRQLHFLQEALAHE